MKTLLSKLAQARKALVAAAGVVAELVAAGVLSGSVEHYAQLALAVLAAVGVYAVPNKPAPAAAAK